MVFTVFQAAFIMRGSFHKETTMPQLHLFYLGGSAGQSNIEVHDVHSLPFATHGKKPSPRSKPRGLAMPTKSTSTAGKSSTGQTATASKSPPKPPPPFQAA